MSCSWVCLFNLFKCKSSNQPASPAPEKKASNEISKITPSIVPDKGSSQSSRDSANSLPKKKVEELTILVLDSRIEAASESKEDEEDDTRQNRITSCVNELIARWGIDTFALHPNSFGFHPELINFANSLSAALVCTRVKYDVIFIDLQLPPQFIEKIIPQIRLHQQSKNKHSYIVAYSSDPKSEIKATEEFFKAKGIDGFVKRLNKEEITAVIDKLAQKPIPAPATPTSLAPLNQYVLPVLDNSAPGTPLQGRVSSLRKASRS